MNIANKIITTTDKILNELKGGDVADKYASIVNSDYSSFVNQIKGFLGRDEKAFKFVQAGMKDGDKNDDRFKVSFPKTPVKSLIPTQNVIDLQKAMQKALDKPEKVLALLNGQMPKSKSFILTFNGKYLIDGHHRWAFAYIINPNINIPVANLQKSGASPFDALKATQLAIVTTTKNLPTAPAEGLNLLTASMQEIEKTVETMLSEDVVKIFVDTLGYKDRRQVMYHLVSNCMQIQKNNRPISGAPDRSIMPQTAVPVGNQPNVLKVLSQGIPNSKAPFVKEGLVDKIMNEAIILSRA